jgi:acetyltransferase-like isoleucine patch superfamily enzyme
MNRDFQKQGAPVAFYHQPTVFQKYLMMLGHYDLRIYITETAYVDVGRGSFEAVKFVNFVSPEFSGCVGRIGQFCNFALTCELFGGGEHRNSQPVNVVFTNVPAFDSMVDKHKADDLRPAPQEPFEIGNAVVVSSGAKILPGAKIGDGALIAAGAVVAGAVEPFAIAGGVPAKHIKYRLDEQTRLAMANVRWWEFDTAYLGNSLSVLQQCAIDTGAQHVYRPGSHAFVLKVINARLADASVQVLGFLLDDEIKPIADAPQHVIDYLNQIAGPGPYRWVPNIWDID